MFGEQEAAAGAAGGDDDQGVPEGDGVGLAAIDGLVDEVGGDDGGGNRAIFGDERSSLEGVHAELARRDGIELLQDLGGDHGAPGGSQSMKMRAAPLLKVQVVPVGTVDKDVAVEKNGLCHNLGIRHDRVRREST